MEGKGNERERAIPDINGPLRWLIERPGRRIWSKGENPDSRESSEPKELVIPTVMKRAGKRIGEV